MRQKKHVNKFLDGRLVRTDTKDCLEDTNNNNVNAILLGSRGFDLSSNPKQNLKMQKIIQSNFLMARLKAFITDMFLLNMPLLYFTTYIVLDGKDEFLHNNIAIGLCEMSYCGILIFFFYFTGQSPGFRYAEIMLCQTRIQKSAQDIIKMQPKKFLKPSLLQTCIYVIVWLIELSFFLWIFSFMRKDKRTLHEILSHTQIIYKENRGVKS